MDIKQIKDDKFLKEMKNKDMKILCEDIRNFLLENISKTGGHLSSNLGSVELIVALHKVFDFDKDKVLFDVGHQAYTHKILTGRAKEFDKLRKTDGLSGFLSNEESNYDIFESGHSSTSISTAMGMALAKNKEDNYEIISVIGDASIANGIAFEALNNIQEQKNKIIIILNDNDMSINKSVGAMAKSLSKVRTSKSYAVAKKGFSKTFAWAPRFRNFIGRCVHRLVLIFRSDNIFDNFNISYLGPIDGHNIKALTKAFKKAKEFPFPIIVHVKTKKGKGYSFAENDNIGKYHGIGPFDLDSGKVTKNNENTISFTKEASTLIYNAMKEHEDAYLICSSMVYSTNLYSCFNDFNERCVDVGIAEEHSISLANGLALANKRPIVSLYSTFLQRGYDEIVHDVCRVNSDILFMIDRAGIVGEDGKTHQGILDVSFLYPLENSILTCVSSTKYFKPLFDCLYNIKGPRFIRYQKMNVAQEDTIIDKVEFGKFIYEIYDKDNEKSIIAVGASVEVIKQMIIEQNLKINLINALFLKPIDEQCLKEISNTKIYVYDNTSVFDGFASAIVHFYNALNMKVKTFVVPNKFIEFGQYKDILKKYHLDEETVLTKIKED